MSDPGRSGWAQTICPGCKYPEPANWCWEHRLRCPLKYPPRNTDTRDLLTYLNALEDRIEKLESHDLP